MAGLTCVCFSYLRQLTNWLVALMTPILLDASAFGAYFLFGGLALFTAGVLAAYMPETRGRSLEDIQQAFQRPALSGGGGGVSRYLRRVVPGLRHRVSDPPGTPADEEIELQLHRDHQTAPVGATSVSLEGVARTSLRFDVSSA